MTTPAPDQALNAFAKVTIVTDANAITFPGCKLLAGPRNGPSRHAAGCHHDRRRRRLRDLAYADGWVTPDERRRMLGLWTRKRPGSCDTPG